ncbi:Undecaprenyl-phosphate mannosyltransferase [Gimesia maris]|uniref:glycosyltransferase family 2 protein n=1 Tax=Gimesia maris TaxID=122 RepID=UPI00118C8495|nr:glycosyltransferase family 2 protein [Gimesia maris]QDU16207.1 Undecaprenyl-phosphate mannosyltransferase [Gimesia maris]
MNRDSLTSTDHSVSQYALEHKRAVWVVIAAYNEESRLQETLSGLCTTDWNIVVVDDGSTDATFQNAQQFPVWVLQHPVNCGQGAALKTGIDFALKQGADVIVTFDADGQHAASEIPSLVDPVLSGDVDVALGSRFLGVAKDIPWLRQLTLKLGIQFTRLTSGLKLTDVHNGFRAFSRNAAETIQIRQPRMAHASEILEEISRLRMKYVEVPVTITYHTETLEKGQSSLGALKITGHLLAGRIWK